MIDDGVVAFRAPVVFEILNSAAAAVGPEVVNRADEQALPFDNMANSLVNLFSRERLGQELTHPGVARFFYIVDGGIGRHENEGHERIGGTGVDPNSLKELDAVQLRRPVGKNQVRGIALDHIEGFFGIGRDEQAADAEGSQHAFNHLLRKAGFLDDKSSHASQVIR